MTTSSWEVVRHREPPSAFHAREVPTPARRSVWVCDPTVTALVLGSAQDLAVADADACAAVDIEVVQRRSGGGAVLVAPGDLLWVDVILPSDDPLWQADVGRAFVWLGDAWSAALAALRVPSRVHEGALIHTPWSRIACFAGLGSGELLSEAGRKVVGISQRRTRGAARFQCAALLRWDAEALLSLLRLPAEDRAAAAAALAGAAAGLDLDPEVLLEAFLQHLP